MSGRSADATERPPCWPPGVDADNLCPEDHCDYCDWLREQLEKHRAGIAADGRHAALDSFAQT